MEVGTPHFHSTEMRLCVPSILTVSIVAIHECGTKKGHMDGYVSIEIYRCWDTCKRLNLSAGTVPPLLTDIKCRNVLAANQH